MNLPRRMSIQSDDHDLPLYLGTLPGLFACKAVQYVQRGSSYRPPPSEDWDALRPCLRRVDR